MTAFDHFQNATCQIADGDKAGAVESLDAALAQIARDGIDADLRDDLKCLRDTCAS